MYPAGGDAIVASALFTRRERADGFTLRDRDGRHGVDMSKKPRDRIDAVLAEPAPWSGLVLICSKCVRKHGREELRGDLRRALKHAGHRDLRVVLGGCLDLCPKHGITVARGADLGARPPRLWVLDNQASAEDLARWVIESGADHGVVL